MPSCSTGKKIYILVVGLCICQVFPVSDHRVSPHYKTQKGRRAVESSSPACFGHTEHSSTHTLPRFQLLFSDTANPKEPHTFLKAQFNSPPKAHRDEGDTIPILQFVSRSRNQDLTVLFILNVSLDHWNS